MVAMFLRRLLPATAALISAAAIAAPITTAGADPAAPSPDVCNAINAEGAMAVLGPYGPLGAFGPTGAAAGQPNPATACGGSAGFALPGFTVGSYVTSILSLAGQHP